MKVAEFMGYVIEYNNIERRFEGCAREGNVLGDCVATGATQEEVENQLKILAKSAMHLPVPVFVQRGGYLIRARLTSLNPSRGEGWVVFDGKTLPDYTKFREKVTSSSRVFPDTAVNCGIHAEVVEKNRAITHIQAEIKEALTRLEGQLNLTKPIEPVSP